MIEMARGFLSSYLAPGLGIAGGHTYAMLEFAFSTGVLLRDEEGGEWPLSGDDMDQTSQNFFDAMVCMRDGLLEFNGTDFSQLVALAKEDSAAYDACLMIASSNLELGLTPELANMLRSHLKKPSRPSKGSRNKTLRDEAIQYSVYMVCEVAGIKPTRNSSSNNSGCDIVQEAMSTLPECTEFGLPSYEGVRKIWDNRKFPVKDQAKQNRRKN